MLSGPSLLERSSVLEELFFLPVLFFPVGIVIGLGSGVVVVIGTAGVVVVGVVAAVLVRRRTGVSQLCPSMVEQEESRGVT